eukprot:14824970-Ditylum_brightwellii.AAC.1
MVGDPETRLPSYLLGDRKKKGDFCIGHVIKEANNILDCDSSIDGEEIENLHSKSSIAKEVKKTFKEEEQAAMGDPWINCVLIKKSGDTKITRFAVQED